MSLADATDRLRRTSTVDLRGTLTSALFGDRIGLLAFLGSVCLFGVVWQTEVFISDTYALANALYALTNGELFLTEAAYGPSLETPGISETSRGRIARSYGVIVLSLPLWVLLEGVTLVADLRVALVGLWSLALLAFVVHLGRALGRETVGLGAGVVVALFGANVALAHSLDTTATHLYALQLFHIVVTGFLPVLCYRLLVRLDTRRVAVTTTAAVVLGTPLTLWATIAKRHAITATVVFAVAYALYRSRTEPDGVLVEHAVTFRALAYGLVGLYAWVFAPVALLVLVVLAALDLPTATDNSPRTLLVVGGVFLLSLIPFFVTNLALTGSPVTPPNVVYVQGAAGGGSAGSSGPVLPWLPGPLAQLLAALLTVTRPLEILGRALASGLVVFLTEPGTVFQTLFRSGDAAGALNNAGTESVNLSLLESAPVLGALAGGLPVVWRRLRAGPLFTRRPDPDTVVDLFAVLFCVGLTLQFINRLPIHAQLTVRYLFPLFPIGVYLLARVPVVRSTVATHRRLFAWATAATVLVGGQLIAVAVFYTAVGLGEAFQLHALLALGTAAPLAAWSLLGRSDGRFGRAGAVLVGVATGLATVFVLLVALEYYSIGNSHLLPMVRVVAESLDLL